MNEAPKKIWVANDVYREETTYIRADLVNWLVEALEGMLQAYGEFDLSYGGHDHAVKAQVALKALEET